MAIATVQLPDGRIADVEVPDGATEEDLHSFLSQQFGASEPSQQSLPEKDSGFLEKAGQFAMGIPQGLGNKFVGAVQTGTDIVAPQSEFAKNLASQVTNLKQRQKQLPGSEKAGIFGGEIAGDIALSPTKGLGFTGQAIGSGAVSGLTTPLEQSGAKGRIEEVGKDAALSAVFGKGTQLLGEGVGAAKEGVKNIYKGAKARLPEELAVVGQAIKQKSSDLYRNMRSVGSTINPATNPKIISDIRKSINSVKLNPRLHGDTISVMDDLENALNSSNVGIDDLDQYRQLFRDVVTRNTDARGIQNGDAFIAGKAIDKLDETINNLKPTDLANFKYSEDDLKEAVKEGFKLKELEKHLLGNIKGNSKAASVVGSNPAYSKEYQSLRNLESNLLSNIRGNSKAAGFINEEASKKLGFWRNRARQGGYEFVNEAAQDARSLQNVKKQITEEARNLKPANSEFLTNTAGDAKSLQNVRKQIADQENLIKEIENNLTTAPEIAKQGQQAKELLLKARDEWKRARKFEKLSEIVEKADGDPQRIKVLTKNLVSNKKNLYGYSAQERSALKQIANGTNTDKALKFLGGFGIASNNKLLPTVAGIGGYSAGMPLGAAAAIGVGTAARQAQKYLARGKLDDALKLIESTGNPSQVISKIPNRKLQEKLLNQLFAKGSAAAISESNN